MNILDLTIGQVVIKTEPRVYETNIDYVQTSTGLYIPKMLPMPIKKEVTSFMGFPYYDQRYRLDKVENGTAFFTCEDFHYSGIYTSPYHEVLASIELYGDGWELHENQVFDMKCFIIEKVGWGMNGFNPIHKSEIKYEADAPLILEHVCKWNGDEIPVFKSEDAAKAVLNRLKAPDWGVKDSQRDNEKMDGWKGCYIVREVSIYDLDHGQLS